MKPLELITQLLGILSLIQGIEYLQLNRAWSERGVWRSSTLSRELGPWLACSLNQKSFYVFNIIRLIAALIAIGVPNVFSIGVLFIIHALTMIRSLGSFNGGSDSMTSILLLATLLGLLFPRSLASICLWYMALQLCISYFKAGWVKIKNSNWRRGEALSYFVESESYEQSRAISRIFNSPLKTLLISWVIIIFELSFPIAFLNQHIAMGFIAIGILFHLGNAYIFGLNRFLYAWLAAYPALYWCAGAN